MSKRARLQKSLAAKTPSIPELIESWSHVFASRSNKRTAKAAVKLGVVKRRAPVIPTPVPWEDHLALMKQTLQAAVTLEFATIPPYLCALWSIKDELDPAAESIREIVQEEMLHMALTCNMLAAIGGEPQICTPGHVATYPAHLPGDVHPDLIVSLSRLSDASLKCFLTIERPSLFPSNVERGPEDDAPPDRSIGDFYDCILKGFQQEQNQFEAMMVVDHQITGPLAWQVIRNVKNVEGAIGLIKRQGEGVTERPVDRRTKNYAHYFRFMEILRRQKLRWDAKSQKHIYDQKLAFPDAWPMARVPRGGYQEKQVDPAVWNLLNRFDTAYSDLLRLLQEAWTLDGQSALIRAIAKMFELQNYAKPLMQIPIPNKKIKGIAQHYGPCFRYTPL